MTRKIIVAMLMSLLLLCTPTSTTMDAEEQQEHHAESEMLRMRSSTRRMSMRYEERWCRGADAEVQVNRRSCRGGA